MKTLHVTKDIRDKFCHHAQKLIEQPLKRVMTSEGSKRTSDVWLQRIFEELRTAKYNGSWSKSRIKLQPPQELEDMLRQQIVYGLRIPSNLVLFNEAIWYPPKGYHEWRDGHEQPGWHAQFIYAQQPARSFIKTYHEGQWDAYHDSGFDFRMFFVGNSRSGEPRFWHCVYSDTNRIVVDFRLLNRDRGSF